MPVNFFKNHQSRSGGALSDPQLRDPLAPSLDNPAVLRSTVLTAQGALAHLSARFPNQPPGPLSKVLQSAPPGALLDARITYGILTSRAFSLPDPHRNVINRETAELGIVAQSQTKALFNSSRLVEDNIQHNGYGAGNEYKDSKVQAKQQVDTYMGMGLIEQSHRVLDIGSDIGAFIKALRKAGVSDVWGVEPGKPDKLEYLQTIHEEKGKPLSRRSKEAVAATIGKTVEEYLESSFFKPVDVATINNFNPSFSSEETMLASLPKLLKPDNDAKAIVGVCGCDPQRATPGSPYNLGDKLAQYFGDVKFVSSLEAEIGRDTGSVGGQMGFYICREPRRPSA